jgi:hypothetical protein
MIKVEKSMIVFIRKYLYILPRDCVVFIILINIRIQIKLPIIPNMLTAFMIYLLITSLPGINPQLLLLIFINDELFILPSNLIKV